MLVTQLVQGVQQINRCARNTLCTQCVLVSTYLSLFIIRTNMCLQYKVVNSSLDREEVVPNSRPHTYCVYLAIVCVSPEEYEACCMRD